MDKSIIAKIVGNEYTEDWTTLSPKVYYKDGEPFGIIGVRDVDGIRYLATTCIDINVDFTVGMIRDIIHHYNEHKICIVSGTVHRQDLIRKGLSRFKFRYEQKGNIMYAYGANHE